MADRSSSSTQDAVRLGCTRCGSLIELCACCEGADCSNVICYRCLRQELGQSIAQPHVLGG